MKKKLVIEKNKLELKHQRLITYFQLIIAGLMSLSITVAISVLTKGINNETALAIMLIVCLITGLSVLIFRIQINRIMCGIDGLTKRKIK